MENNHGGSGSKFVSVNLNKLYGQPSHHNYPPRSGSYGPGIGINRARPGGHASSGGGMVVLSRNRPLQKTVPKLSVPPPLNLPSLRKEYEKMDSSGSGGGAVGSASLGSGSRPSSSGMSWTKPGNVSLQEKEGSGDNQVLESLNYTEGVATKGSGTYMPHSARFGDRIEHRDMASARRPSVASLEKAMVLRGEDFPSLRAALPSSTGPTQKQNEGSFQKVKQLVSEESSNDIRNSSHISSLTHMQSSHHIASGVTENGGQSPKSSSARVDHAQKQEDPLSQIWVNPRSDWADDERDTGRGFAGRSGRDQHSPKSKIYWDRDFDVPRSSILSHQPPNNLSERRSQHIGSIAKGSTSEVLKAEPYRREINLYSRDRESNSWINSSILKDKSTPLQVNNEGNNVTWPDSLSNGKYMSSMGNNTQNDAVTGIRDAIYMRRDVAQGGQRHWSRPLESPRYRGEGYQNSAGSKFYSISGKGHSMNDPPLNLGKDKSSFLKSGHTYLDSSDMYDERDPFTGNLVGMVKRKKDVIKHTDFHDPVRESFEAELERVQNMQKMERQRIIEEQERALEKARREDEERRRVIMEEEERRRRMEEEARETAWRAEQERLEAIQKAEEQKIAREKEKKRMLLEEERRKQAAKQKLLELEAKIAKREAEDGFSHVGDRDHIWSSFGDGEPFGRNRDIESELYDNIVEKYGEVGWGRGNSRGNVHTPYTEQESDKHYQYGRSRYSMKQPRVLPPPSLASVPKSSVRGEDELSAPSSSLESTARMANYGGPQDKLEESDIVDVQQEIMAQKLEKNETPRCDSQSSLSVSSPPSSPTHISDDELDDSGHSVMPSATEGKELLQREIMNDESGTKLAASKSVSADEYEEWTLENHDGMQEQEEHDEDDDGYREEDEVHELIDENVKLTQEFEHMHLDEKIATNVMDNLVLGFNDGVEVRITGDTFEGDLRTDRDTVEMAEDRVSDVEKHDAVIREPKKAQSAQKPTSNMLGDSSVSSGPSDQHTVPFAGDMASNLSSGQSTVPVFSSVSSQPDLPVKLQLGLFSGPSLIPSLVPAIQIGTIQMPLHLQPPIGSSMGHIYPSQPPLFQFGQLRYTSPVSQGILPLTPQPMPVVQPNNHHTHFNLNQSSGSPLSSQLSQESSANSIKRDDSSTNLVTHRPANVSTMSDLPHENWSRGSSARGNVDYNDMLRSSQSDISHVADNIIASKSVTETEDKRLDTTVNDSHLQQFTLVSSQGLSGEKDVPSSKAPGSSSVNKGKRTSYPARNFGPKSFQACESSPLGFGEFHRRHRHPIQQTEFRVTENDDRRQMLGMGSSNSSGLDDKVSHKGIRTSMRSGYRHHMVSNLKTNISEEDVDAPLQSGIVRVFKQPGIECPSDEDDFIEVRSKRHMLNNRREQREKEMKAKSCVTKQSRRFRSSNQGPNKTFVSLVGEASNNIHSDFVGSEGRSFVGSEGRSLVNKEPSTDFSTIASQPLAPTCTSALDTDVQSGIRLHTSSKYVFTHGN